MRFLNQLIACLVAVTNLFPILQLHGAEPPGQPNVLMIAIDDLRPELSSYGAGQMVTPNFDQLALESFQFNRAYVQQAVCSPSRTSIMTGLRPDTTLVYDLETHFRDTIPWVETLPQYLQSKGYYAAAIGKIYHGSLNDEASWSEPWIRGSGAYGAILGEKPPTEGIDEPESSYRDGAVTDEAVLKLQDLKNRQPFFYGVGYVRPHLPFVAPKAYWDLYDEDDLELPHTREHALNASQFAYTSWGELRNYDGIPGTGPVSLDQEKDLIHGYYACVSFIDAQVGRLLNALESEGLSENTIVVVWGDHGWHLGDHGQWCKHTNFERATRIPLFIKVPWMPGAARIDAFAEAVDIYPTLLDLCGITGPGYLEGDSLVPLLENPDAPGEPFAMSQYRRWAAMGYSMRTDRYRYTEWRDRDTNEVLERELYDHDLDPLEDVNVVDQLAYADALPMLETYMESYLLGGTPLEYWTFDGMADLDIRNAANSGYLSSQWNFGGPDSMQTDGSGHFVISSHSGQTYRKLPKQGTLHAESSIDQYADPIQSGRHRLEIDYASWTLDAASVGSKFVVDAREEDVGTIVASITLTVVDSSMARIELLTQGQSSAVTQDFALSEVSAVKAEIILDLDADVAVCSIDDVPLLTSYSFTSSKIGQLRLFTNAEWSSASRLEIDAMGLLAEDHFPVVTGLELLDPDTQEVIQQLQYGDSLDLNAIGQRDLIVRATTHDADSIEFKESDRINRIENAPPFIMGGHVNGTMGAWMPALGNYILEAVPFKSNNGSGLRGMTFSLPVTVTDSLDHRMRQVRIHSSVSNAEVAIRMKKHAFPFGSMTKASIVYSDTADEQMYRETFLENFNYSVVGNAMKWYSNQPQWWSGSPHNNNYSIPGKYRYDDADNWLDYMESLSIPVRGHTLLWGAGNLFDQSWVNSHGQMWDPVWVQELDTNWPVEPDHTHALYWIENRIKGIAGRYAGRIDEWDFNNEAPHRDWYAESFGPGITKHLADVALAANPHIRLWVNDYNIISDWSDPVGKATGIKNYVQDLLNRGVPVAGIGMQGHFSHLPEEGEIRAALNVVDDLGLPMRITEFDAGWNGASEQQEADAMEMVYRASFEHPLVTGIIMWGFWEGSHWKPERALWNMDWTLTEQAIRYRQLVYDEWWTHADLVTDETGELAFNVFAGDYEITVDGRAVQTTFAASNALTELYFDGTRLYGIESPEVSITTPEEGTSFVTGPGILVQADAKVGDGPAWEVDFYLDGKLVRTDGLAPFTASFNDLPIGGHSVAASARNALGDESVSMPVNFSITQGILNLIENAGFESGTANWLSSGGLSIGTAGNPVYAEGQSGRAYDRDNDYDGFAQSLTGELEPGNTYLYSCQARVSQGNEAPCELFLRTRYLDGTAINQQVAVSNQVNSSGWTRVEGMDTFVVDPVRTIADVSLIIYGAPAGVELYLDEVFAGDASLHAGDRDGDGMPDTWEDAFFGSTDAHPSGDPDGDNMDNISEYRSGTDPQNPGSRFELVSASTDGTSIEISWSSIAGQAYRIMQSASLDGGWTIAQEGLTGTGSEMSATVALHAESLFVHVEIDQ